MHGESCLGNVSFFNLYQVVRTFTPNPALRKQLHLAGMQRSRTGGEWIYIGYCRLVEVSLILTGPPYSHPISLGPCGEGTRSVR